MKPAFKYRILTLATALALFFGCMVPAMSQKGAERSTIKTSLDSVYLLMGKVTPLHIEVFTNNPNGEILVPADYNENPPILTEGIEIAGMTETAKEDKGNNRYRLSQDLVIQSFDSGDYVIPPILFVSGTDTFSSNTLALKVVPVNVDTLPTIHSYAPPLDGQKNIWARHEFNTSYAWLWWTLLALAILGVAGFYAYKKLKKPQPVKKQVKAAPKPIKRELPHIVALRELGALHDEQLCERGEEKEFYTRLTDILRRYIDARFGINAMEMTSTQILKALHRAGLPQEHIKQVLSIADYVKFAKMRPFSDDNAQAYSDAVAFVQDTGPKPEETPPSGNENQNPQN